MSETVERRRRIRPGSSDPDNDDAIRQRKRRARRTAERARRARAVRRQKVMAAAIAVFVLLIAIGGTMVLRRAWATSTLSEAVLGYRGQVKKCAEKEGIKEYTDVLLAIMMVESEGEGKDVMQSSESKGLETNSLEPDESIEQACIYFAALVDIAHTFEIDDRNALIQAYNFGPGYLYFISDHGGKHTQELATEYAKEQSGGEKVRYLHLYAIKENGGWIYGFGNMFYAAIVQQYL
jgi:preprotein translocase subunit Sec61beta